MKRTNEGKRKRTAPRVWSAPEEIKIAHYMVENPYLGKDQGKETLIQYERRMLQELDLSNCDTKCLKNKCASMKKKYEETHKWIDQTGQGVQNNDPDSFPGVIIKMCHYYYILDEVLSSSQTINTSYQRSFGEDSEPLRDLSNAIPESSVTVPIATHFATAILTPTQEENENELVLSLPNDSVLGCDVESSRINTPSRNARFVESLGKRDSQSRKNLSTSLNQQLAAAYTSKCESMVTVEKLKLEFETKKWENTKTLELKKIEAETINKDKELELKRLAIEEKKLELEILKLQHSKT